jgi:hypothetical protein
MVALLSALALLILGIAALAWFREPRRWLVALGVVLMLLALLIHALIGWVTSLDAGFESYPGGFSLGTGCWLPLIGFPLSAIGLVAAARASAQRHTTPTAFPDAGLFRGLPSPDGREHT